MKSLALLLLLATHATAAHAQAKHNGQWDQDQWEHAAAGAAVSLALRGPWVAPAFRDRLWKRGAVLAVLTAGFEVYQHYIFGWDAFPFIDTVLDFVATMTGWVVVEVVDRVVFR